MTIINRPNGPVSVGQPTRCVTRESKGVAAFNDDVSQRGHYSYTGESCLGSVLANQRLTEATLKAGLAPGLRLLDIGSGDGTFTVELLKLAALRSAHGIDRAVAAVSAARCRFAGTGLTFAVGDAYALPFDDGTFDVAYLRGVLHHLDRPRVAVAEAARVAQRVVIVEPNGYNLALKLRERVSPYYRRHGERSYRASTIDRWLVESSLIVQTRQWVGFVPLFSQSWTARLLKRVEPFVERAPTLGMLACAAYVVSASGSAAHTGNS